MKSRMGITAAVGMVLLGSVLVTASAAGTKSEEAGARKAVELYLEGHATGKVEPFRQAFHPEMKMFLNRKGEFIQRTAAEYMAGVKGQPAPDEARRKRRIVSLDVTGDVGVAKVELDYPDAFMTDYLTLLKTGDTWHIINKVVHVQTR
jgi:hypothetical protein